MHVVEVTGSVFAEYVSDINPDGSFLWKRIASKWRGKPMPILSSAIFRVGIAPACKVVVSQEESEVAGIIFDYNTKTQELGSKRKEIGFDRPVKSHFLTFIGRVYNG